MAQSFRVEGLRELEIVLAELPKATGKNVLKRALLDAAEPIRADAEAKAPVLTGALRLSVTAGTALTRRQKSQHTKVSPVEVFVGPGGLPQATTQEFGTSHNAAQPYLRPAWDGNKMRALEIVKDALAKRIEEARARLARKAERLAAKIKTGT